MEGGTDTLNLYTLSATFSTGQNQIKADASAFKLF